MKLRQKLAVVLASAMVVTAVPVVTMAASTNKIVRSTQVIEKDSISTDAALRVKFEDGDGAEEFYLTLTNAEWIDTDDAEQLAALEATNGYTSGTNVSGCDVWTFELDDTKNGGTVEVTYTRQSDTTVKVNLVAQADTQVSLPLPIKVKKGEVSVAITSEGAGSTITEGNYSFVTTGEKAASVAVGDLNSFYDNGELSKITLKETFVGSLAQDLILEVELDDTDFEFLASSKVEVKGTYGFAGQDNTTNKNITVNFYQGEDESTAYIHITGVKAGKSLGRLEITGLKVRNNEKDIEAGQLLADITLVDSFKVSSSLTLTSSAELDKTYSNVAVANIANYGAYIQMKDEKAVDIVAGREEEVEFTVAETVDDTFVGGRKIEITLDSDEYEDAYFWVKNDEAAFKALISEDDAEIVESVDVEWYDDEAPKAGEYGKVNTIIVELAGQDKDGEKLNTNEEKDEFTVKTTIYVPVDQKEKTDLTLVASMRGVDEFKSAKAVNIINPFNVTFEQTTLKVGLQDQKAGSITLTETDKEMFQKGSIILDVVNGSKAVDGIVIEDAGTLTVTGDLKKADLDTATNNKQADEIVLKRQSKAASTLTVSEMEITVDRTVPEGSYDLVLSGDAIDVHGGELTIEDYIVIGTPNTQDISASNGLAKGTATFSVGTTTYTVNGVEKTMDAAAYIQDPGYTMVPVRYVAEAFGITGNNIMFGSGTVTMFAGNRTVQLTNGSNVAVVNGASVSMSTAVVIKEGRTYAPIGEIARILGVSSSWDNTTKVATFENK